MSEQATAPAVTKELTHADFYAMAQAKVRTKWVQHPDYGRVRIRILRGFERDSNEAARYEINRETGDPELKLRNVRASLVVRGLAKDDDGARMFPKDDVADIIGKIEGPCLDWLYDEILAFNKMRKVDQKRLKKNFASDQSDDSGSDSLGISE